MSSGKPSGGVVGKSPASSSTSSSSSSVHQRLSMLTSSSSGTTNTTSSTTSKPFMRSKSQTTSSIVFPSFRFSPESEEIQEITATDHQRGGDVTAASENGTAAASASSSSKEDSSSVEGTSSSSSSSSSSKQGGDISPLKEYILKHKWTNKWEKRSLSLDLDLKGKIITAIEDKRRSFVSHFLNEEDEEVIVATAPTDSAAAAAVIIDRSYSIPEQLVAGGTNNINTTTAAATTSTSASCLALGTSSSDPDYYDDSSIHSDSVVLTATTTTTTMLPRRRRGVNNSNSNRTTRLNMFEDTNFDYGDDDINDYFSNSNGSPVHSVSPAEQLRSSAELRDLVVEEVGVDCIEELLGSCPSSPDPLSLLRQFVLPPEQLQERFQGLPTLYNPPSVVKNLRKYPSQEVAGVITTTAESTSDPQQAEQLPTTTTATTSDDNNDTPDSSVLTFPGMVFSIFRDVYTHPWVKYWFVGISVLFVVGLGPFFTGLVSFALGVTAVLIVNGALYPNEALVPAGGGGRIRRGDQQASTEVVVQQQQPSPSRRLRRRSVTPQAPFTSSQGWMCTLDTSQQYPAYNAFEFHLRNTKAVFIRLDGPTLVISTPHSRHRVSRRRLWSDPPITTDIVFVRHQQFNLMDAKVEIVPHGLTRKRVWCKKYPIAVTLATKDKFCGKLLSVTSGFLNNSSAAAATTSTQDESAARDGGGAPSTSVSYSKGDGVKVKDVLPPPQPDAVAETYKGEVYRDESSCAGKTIYLFARTDREKDDWFRRLVKASRITPSSVHQTATSSSSSTSPQQPAPPSQSQPGIFSATSLDPESLPPVSYMQKSCPTITIPRCLVTMPTTTSSSSSPSTPSRRSTPTNELNSSGSNSSGGGPPGSQKTTPEKEQRLRTSGTTTTTDISPGLFPAESLLMMSSTSCTPTFLNALISRLGYDFLHSERWKSEVISLIDRKLLFLRKPSFVQSLRVRELDMGDSLPVLTNASTPVLDDQGLWVDFDVRFEGSLVITIEAFVNFLNLKTKEDSVQLDMRSSGTDHNHDHTVRVNVSSSQPGSPSKHAMFDSDADDSGESSESEDDQQFDGDEDPTSSQSNGGASSSGTGAGSSSSSSSSSSHATNGHHHHHHQSSNKQDQPTQPPPQDSKAKLFKYADTIVKSSVMRNKHVQKVVGNFAATPILLIVEVNRVIGPVALNIPPVPNNRVWIGFRSNPIIDINAKPKVGERFIGFTQVTGWIRKKLLLEFQRIMVCPNMMDVSLSFLQYDLPK